MIRICARWCVLQVRFIAWRVSICAGQLEVVPVGARVNVVWRFVPPTMRRGLPTSGGGEGGGVSTECPGVSLSEHVLVPNKAVTAVPYPRLACLPVRVFATQLPIGRDHRSAAQPLHADRLGCSRPPNSDRLRLLRASDMNGLYTVIRFPPLDV